MLLTKERQRLIHKGLTPFINDNIWNLLISICLYVALEEFDPFLLNQSLLFFICTFYMMEEENFLGVDGSYAADYCCRSSNAID